MKTILSILFALVPLLSFAQPIQRNAITTNRFMIGLPSDGQVPQWNATAGRYSNATPSTAAQVWTNSNGTVSNTISSTVTNLLFDSSVPINASMYMAKFQNKGTNKLTIDSRGSIAIGYPGSAFPISDDLVISRREDDGESDASFIFVFPEASGIAHSIYGNLDASQSTFVVDHNNTNNVFIGALPTGVYIQGTDAEEIRFLLFPGAAVGAAAYTFDTSATHTSGNVVEFKHNGSDLASIRSSGGLTVASTTNHISFGATNAPPASAVAPTRWISVLINGEATQYKIPLYQ